VPGEPADGREPDQPAPPDLARLIAGVVAFGLLMLGGLGVLMLGPNVAPDEQPLSSSGDVVAHVIMRPDASQALLVRRGNVDAITVGEDGQFVKFQPTARPADVNGDGRRDLAIYGWTGGMHCCFTHFIFDGVTGAVLGSFEQAGDTPAQLVRLRDEQERAVLVIDDTASRDLLETGADQDGSMIEPPWPTSRAIAVVGWNRTAGRLTLDRDLMAAGGPDLPAPYWQSQPDLAQAVTAKTGAEGFEPPRGLLQRGELARSYKTWLDTLQAAMIASVGSPSPAVEPVRAYLDEMVYKGQARAAIAQIYAATRAARPPASDPSPATMPAPAPGEAVELLQPSQAAPGGDMNVTEAIVVSYLRDIRASPWFADLDTMNGGALSTPPAPAAP
jgi:hypothetical protein